jgi:transcriptional regulator with GAF, ATPase, and Fis domain
MLQVFADHAAMALKSAYLFRERERYKERLQDENAYLRAALREEHGFADVVGQSAALRAALRKVQQVAGVETTVLLTGETGTGKELLARAIHDGSPRRDRPMVKVNCGAIPAGVVESELFGHEKGAFTGAIQKRLGRFELAEGGTIFLDEVGELSPDVQVKLLRVLEDRVVSRLGENVWREVDFRIITATNRALPALIEAGLFAPDLYERLAIVRIHLLPLRERLEDLPALTAHFVARFAREQQRPPVASVRADVLRALAAYPWPGNIRELRNVVYQALVAKRGGDEILAADLPRRILGPVEAPAGVDRAAITRRVAAGTMNLRALVAEVEHTAITVALEHAGGSPARAARLLGEVGRGGARDPAGTLKAMMRRLGITR